MQGCAPHPKWLFVVAAESPPQTAHISWGGCIAESSLTRLSGALGVLARSTRQRLPPLSIGALGLLGLLSTLGFAFLPLSLLVAAVVALVAVGLALWHPLWAVVWAVLSVPIQERLSLPAGLSATQAALLLLLASLIWWVLLRPEGRVPAPGRISLAVALLVWVLGLSAALSPYSMLEGVRETLRWSTVWLAHTAAVISLGSLEGTARRRGALLLLGALLLAPSANALYGLWQFVTADGPPSFLIAGGRFARAYGTIGQPNSFAGSLNMAWPLAAAALLWGGVALWQRPRARLLWLGVALAGLATVLCLAALGASFSRGGWLGAVGGAIGLGLASAVMLPARWRRALLSLAALGALGALLLVGLAERAVLPAPLAERISSITSNLRLFDVRSVEVDDANFAIVERMSHLQAALSMWRDHPLSGVGAGSFSLAYEDRTNGQLRYTSAPWYISQGHAHNYYLHIAAEAGLLGLGTYLGLLGALLVSAYRAAQRAASALERAIAGGGAGVIAAVAAHNLFENLHVLNLGLQLGALWALLIAVERGALAADEGAE